MPKGKKRPLFLCLTKTTNMRKFIKTLLLSLGMIFITTLTTPNATDGTLYDLVSSETPESLYTMRYFGVGIRTREDIKHYPALFPLNIQDATRISSFYGERNHPIYNTKHIHTGIDIAAYKGSPVIATGDGIVASIKGLRGYGRQIVIEHKDEYSTRYAHLSKILVEEGAIVMAGDTIGEVGSSGLSTGNHLHYEISHHYKYIDPLSIYPDTIQEQTYLTYLQDVNNHYLSCYYPNV